MKLLKEFIIFRQFIIKHKLILVKKKFITSAV